MPMRTGPKAASSDDAAAAEASIVTVQRVRRSFVEDGLTAALERSRGPLAGMGCQCLDMVVKRNPRASHASTAGSGSEKPVSF